MVAREYFMIWSIRSENRETYDEAHRVGSFQTLLTDVTLHIGPRASVVFVSVTFGGNRKLTELLALCTVSTCLLSFPHLKSPNEEISPENKRYVHSQLLN